MINQGLLSKIGWGISGYGLCHIIKSIYMRYELRDECLQFALPEDFEQINIFYDNVICNMTIQWTIIVLTGIIIAIKLHGALPLYAGVCAGLATLYCKFLGTVSLWYIDEYYRQTWLYTPEVVLNITSICGLVSIISITVILYAGLYIYDRCTL